MKIAVYSIPAYMDTALPLVNQLAESNEVYLIIGYHTKKATTISSTEGVCIHRILSSNLTDIVNFLGEDVFKLIAPNANVVLVRYLAKKIFNPVKYVTYFLLTKFLYRLKPDIIHFQSQDIALIMPLLRKFPQVVTIHDPVPHTGEEGYGAEIFKKIAMHYADQLIVHSENGKLALCNKYEISAHKINVIYLGTLTIFRHWMQEKIEEEHNLILSFGRISPYKGIEYLIRAVPIVKRVIPDLKVIIAGSGELYFNTESIKNDNTYTIINRYITNDELTKLIQQATVVVCPYTDATQSGVIMTAYAFNKPVVATAVGGIPEVVEDNITGKLVPPRNSKALAEAIIELLLDKAKREDMKKNIAQVSSKGKLSWDYIAKQTIEVYKRAIYKKRI